ncbi:hypothetical protein PM082_012643 [Marasmius tenuissimus]|nr:hypothetical protein PM082_012643 [Marasmius tenuissimus]
MITKSAVDTITGLVIPNPCQLPESNIWTQLRSLQPVAVSDASSLHIHLNKVDLEITIFNQLIRALESRILEAQSKRDSLQRHASQVLSLLSPIRRLPWEIMVKIFKFAANIGSMGDNILGTSSQWMSRAFRISAVCFRWRTIALDTPELWAHFAVDLQTRAKEPLDLFLDRSRQRPLSLAITHTNRRASPALSVLRSLAGQSSRWSSVDYHYLRHDETLTLMNAIQELPLVEHVVCPARGLGTPVTLNEQLRQCALLDTLTIRYDKFPEVDIPSLPLSHPGCLIFQYGPKEAFNNSLKVLKSCADVIEELTYESLPDEEERGFIFQANHASPWDIQEPIKCKQVGKLLVHFYHPDGIYPHLSDIFRLLTLPSLVNLGLLGDCSVDRCFEGSWPAALFDEFVVRSKCQNLTSLNFYLPLSDAEVIASLQHFLALEELHITELFTEEIGDIKPDKLVKTVTKMLVEKLTVADPEKKGHSGGIGPQSFLTKLRSLRLWVRDHFDADEEFVEMVKSRWYPFYSGSVNDSQFLHCRLESVTLVIQDRDVERSVYKPLKVLDSEGMRVVVKANRTYIV